jgi:hypothetical protein
MREEIHEGLFVKDRNQAAKAPLMDDAPTDRIVNDS